ncbi:MAG: hypothetical protein WAN87_03735 [Thermoplasmata archaeon]
MDQLHFHRAYPRPRVEGIVVKRIGKKDEILRQFLDSAGSW